MWRVLTFSAHIPTAIRRTQRKSHTLRSFREVRALLQQNNQQIPQESAHAPQIAEHPAARTGLEHRAEGLAIGRESQTVFVREGRGQQKNGFTAASKREALAPGEHQQWAQHLQIGYQRDSCQKPAAAAAAAAVLVERNKERDGVHAGC